MRRWIIFILSCCLSTFSIAADIPTEVQGAEHMSKEECIKNKTNDCIQSICMTSTAMDCQEQCAKEAKAQCNLMSQ